MDLEYRVIDGRLAMFKPWDNRPEDWEEYWSTHSVEKLLSSEKLADLGEYNVMAQYLPRDLPVLEAGCGIARIVAALAAQGYSVEGVDYAEELIRRVRAVAPELKVRVGDIYCLDAADGSYGGYISLGVLEHNANGPLDGLREARRVLHRRGFAFVSVPYLNQIRKKLLKRARREENANAGNNLRFYQYYFSEQEFVSFLESAGFEVVKLHPLGAYWGLVKDIPAIGWLHERRFSHERIQWKLMSWCERMPMAGLMRYAHMMMYICRPA